MQCKYKYNISSVSSVSVRPVNKVAFEGKKNLGVSVTQYALIAFIYKLLSVSCSSFGSANATRYSGHCSLA